MEGHRGKPWVQDTVGEGRIVGRDFVVVPVGGNGKAEQVYVGWASLDDFSGFWCAESVPRDPISSPELIRERGGWTEV